MQRRATIAPVRAVLPLIPLTSEAIAALRIAQLADVPNLDDPMAPGTMVPGAYFLVPMRRRRDADKGAN